MPDPNAQDPNAQDQQSILQMLLGAFNTARKSVDDKLRPAPAPSPTPTPSPEALLDPSSPAVDPDNPVDPIATAIALAMRNQKMKERYGEGTGQ